MSVPKGEVYPLWCGIQVPVDAKPGRYTGITTVTAVGSSAVGLSAVSSSAVGSSAVGSSAVGSSAVSFPLALTVSPDSIPAHGDDDPARLSRLRWLNSTLYQDDGLVPPYSRPVTGTTLGVLGREIHLGNYGLPDSIRSYYTPEMTAIGSSPPHELLKGPIKLDVQDPHGYFRIWQLGPLAYTKKTEGTVAWTVTGTNGPLTLTVTGELDFDGTLEYQGALTSSANVNLADVQLNIPMADSAVRYFMGMNLKGGRRPGSYSWKWDVTRNQDAPGSAT